MSKIYDQDTYLKVTLQKEETTDSKLYTKKNSQGNNMYFFEKIETEETHLYNFKNNEEFRKVADDINYIRNSCYDGDGGVFLIGDIDIETPLNCVTKIPNGYYSIGQSRELGYFLIEDECNEGDEYLNIGGKCDEMQDTIDKFYNNEKLYRDMNLKHKLGTLVYGPPGCGKTVKIREIIRQYKSKAVIIFVDDEFPKGLVKNLKYYDHNYIFIFEELTQVMCNQKELANLLLFLDGEMSLDRQLVIATTNYPEDLPANLASRPGRFDKLIEVNDPDDKTRRKYLELLTKKEVSDNIVSLTKGMSIAYLKEIVISSLINEISLEQAIKVNKDRIRKVEKNFAQSERAMGLI